MNNKLFCYGILKRGYELDLDGCYGTKFLGEAEIPGATLYGIGRRWQHEAHPNDGRKFHGVGLRLTRDSSIAQGELWEVPEELWSWLDQIENNGVVYTRKEVEVMCSGATVRAWVYEHNHQGFADKDKIKGGKF